MKSDHATRIIIVGGQPEEAREWGRRVFDLGYHVTAVVSSAEEACARASDSDLALIDYNMGGEAGGVLVSHKLSMLHDLPAVLVAPGGDNGMANRIACSSPAYGCVRFPLDGRELQFVLRNAFIRIEMDSERRRLERQMLAAQKDEGLGRIGHRVAHDFNNILQVMIGNVQLAALDIPADSRAHVSLDRVLQAAMRGAALCKQFLAYSAPGAWRPPHAELSTLIRESQVLLRAIVSKGIRLEFDLARDLPHIDVPAEAVQQILFNLVINASAAIGERIGRIRIVSGHEWLRPEDLAAMVGAPERVEGEYASIEVCDDGGGITAEVAGRMFEPFFTTKFAGSGLGLAAVRDLVDAHQGAIEVENRPKAGATFRIHLPVPRTQSAA